MSGEQIVGSLTVVNGGHAALEIVTTEDGKRAVLLTVETEGDTEAELLLNPASAGDLGLDLLVFGRQCAEFNEQGAEGGAQ